MRSVLLILACAAASAVSTMLVNSFSADASPAPKKQSLIQAKRLVADSIVVGTSQGLRVEIGPNSIKFRNPDKMKGARALDIQTHGISLYAQGRRTLPATHIGDGRIQTEMLDIYPTPGLPKRPGKAGVRITSHGLQQK